MTAVLLRDPATNQQRVTAGIRQQILPLLAVFLTGAAIPMSLGINTSLITGLLVAVFAWREIRAFRELRVIFIVTGVMIANGVILFAYTDPLQPQSLGGALFSAEFLINQAVAVGTVLWAFRRLGYARTCAAYGAGSLVFAVVVMGQSFNNIKYALGVPLVLMVVAAIRSQWIAGTVAVVIALIGMAAGARSFAAFLAGAVVFTFIAFALNRIQRSQPAWMRYATLLLVAAVGIPVAYRVGTELLLNGYLGEFNQHRTALQIEQTGSLITSSRPEWFATFGLMADNIWAPGPGAIPDVAQLAAARGGLHIIGFDGGDYVSKYMFGGHYELHSTIADMWVNFGITGLAAGIGLFAYLVFAVLREVTSPDARIATVFVTLISLWYLLFGPLESNLPLIAFAVALAVHRRATGAVKVPPR